MRMGQITSNFCISDGLANRKEKSDWRIDRLKLYILQKAENIKGRIRKCGTLLLFVVDELGISESATRDSRIKQRKDYCSNNIYYQVNLRRFLKQNETAFRESLKTHYVDDADVNTNHAGDVWPVQNLLHTILKVENGIHNFNCPVSLCVCVGNLCFQKIGSIDKEFCFPKHSRVALQWKMSP